MTPATSPFWNDADIIFRYTRSDALRDGVLVDVSPIAAEAGIQAPVAVTSALWQEYIEPSNLKDMPGQDVKGRLWDLLWMFSVAARRCRNTHIVFFSVLFEIIREDGMWADLPLPARIIQKEVRMKAICGPGDQGEPVITIMLPEED